MSDASKSEVKTDEWIGPGTTRVGPPLGRGRPLTGVGLLPGSRSLRVEDAEVIRDDFETVRMVDTGARRCRLLSD